jgi:hypothetical protein
MNFWDPSADRADLISDLIDAEVAHELIRGAYAEYGTAAEADMQEATRALQEAQRRIDEAAGPYLRARRDPAAVDPAGFAGREVCDADGTFIGAVEGTEVLACRPFEPVEAVMVRHTHGGGQLRAYEPEEVREYLAEGHVVPGNGAYELQAEQQPEAERETEA